MATSPELPVILQIQLEGGLLFRQACVSAAQFSEELARKQNPKLKPTALERQEAYRFLAATAQVWASSEVARFDYLQRFSVGLDAQKANCLHVCRMKTPSAVIGDALFRKMWSVMAEDMDVAGPCLDTALKSGKPWFLVRDYPAAYFNQRHGYEILKEKNLSLRSGTGLALADLVPEISSLMERIEAAFAARCPISDALSG
jgi:hypothetical protein